MFLTLKTQEIFFLSFCPLFFSFFHTVCRNRWCLFRIWCLRSRKHIDTRNCLNGRCSRRCLNKVEKCIRQSSNRKWRPWNQACKNTSKSLLNWCNLHRFCKDSTHTRFYRFHKILLRNLLSTRTWTNFQSRWASVQKSVILDWKKFYFPKSTFDIFIRFSISLLILKFFVKATNVVNATNRHWLLLQTDLTIERWRVY